MQGAPIDRIDLNLLRVLDALIRDGNHRRAADRLGITPSAVSHALARLRRELGDELLVRSGSRMVATPIAQELAPSLREALGAIERALAAGARFDPSSTTARMPIACSGWGGMVVLPALIAALLHQAPGISVEAVHLSGRLLEQLESGEILLAIDEADDVPAGFRKQLLARDHYVCLLRTDHPAAGDELTLDRYLELEHLAIHSLAGRPSRVDSALAGIGKERRIRLTVTDGLMGPAIAARTDLVLTCPSRLARLSTERHPVRVLRPPCPLPEIRLFQLWHERYQGDAAHRFVRQRIASQRRGSTDLGRDPGR